MMHYLSIYNCRIVLAVWQKVSVTTKRLNFFFSQIVTFFFIEKRYLIRL